VKLRLDFRDPGIVGVFPFHCHILDHEDAGMMATVQVNPN
jgi:FtsP/CotA-like multicopper oxidase with cupredoxin domain